MLESGLVVNKDDFSTYDGFQCNVRTKHLSQKQLYQITKWELFKSYFDPSMAFKNYFLKHHKREFVAIAWKTFKLTISEIFHGKQRNQNLGI